MKLYLKNHAERYPVEQLQLQVFAQARSRLPATGLFPPSRGENAI